MLPLSRKRYRISRILSRYSGENWASESSNPLGFNTRLWILRTSCKVRVCPGMISDSGVAEVIACVMGSISRCDGRPQKESAHTHTHAHKTCYHTLHTQKGKVSGLWIMTLFPVHKGGRSLHNPRHKAHNISHSVAPSTPQRTSVM